jgi:hypothetical protein
LRRPKNVGARDLLKEIIALSLLEGLHVPIIVVVDCMEIARTTLSFVILSHLGHLLFLDVIVVVLYIWKG